MTVPSSGSAVKAVRVKLYTAWEGDYLVVATTEYPHDLYADPTVFVAEQEVLAIVPEEMV